MEWGDVKQFVEQTTVWLALERFATPDEAPRYGIVDDDELVVLASDPIFAGFDTTGERVPLADVRLLAPVIPRSKVIGIGKNYHDHAKEMGGEAPTEPLMFLIPNTAVVGPGDPVVMPSQSSNVHYEGELAVVHTTMRGRHTGPFVTYDAEGGVERAFAPTGAEFAVTQSHWFRLREGQVIEHWANRDDMGQARQLGWIPPTPGYLIRCALATRKARKDDRG